MARARSPAGSGPGVDVRVTPVPDQPIAGDCHYQCLVRTRDGRVHWAMSSHDPGVPARWLTLDPRTGLARLGIDMGRALGEDATAGIAQGKIHVRPFEDGDGLLLAATHVGFYRRRRGLAQPGRIPGRVPFGGGHFFAFDPRSGRVDSIARAASEQGIIAMAADLFRDRLFGLTWPSGHLLQVDLARKGGILAANRFVDHGPVCGRAEIGPGPREPVCRTIAVDPRDGRAWWSRRSGDCCFLDPDTGRLGTSGARLGDRRGGEPWRIVAWHPESEAFVGILNDSSTVFRLDPARARCEEIGSISGRGRGKDSPTTARAGAGASLGLVSCPRRGRIFALAREWVRSGIVRCPRIRLAAIDPLGGRIEDHGVLRLPDGRAVEQAESLEVGDGCLYTVGRPSPTLGYRVRARLERRELDAHPGEFRLLEIPEPTF